MVRRCFPYFGWCRAADLWDMSHAPYIEPHSRVFLRVSAVRQKYILLAVVIEVSMEDNNSLSTSTSTEDW